MDADALFWELAAELQAEDPRIVEGTIMNGRCPRVGPDLEPTLWRALLREGVDFVG